MAFPDEPLVATDAVALPIRMIRRAIATMRDEVAEDKSITLSREYLLGLLDD